MKILAIPGSLRTASVNAAFCRLVAHCAPESVHVTVFSGLGALPLFNPDLESAPPDAVQEFRASISHADLVLIASPEYAHGISGVMKNALDWLVSYEGTIGKPMALINTSPRAHHAYEALREVLQTMCATIVAEASVVIPLLGIHQTEDSMRSDAHLCQSVAHWFEAATRYLSGAGDSGPAFPVS